MNRSDMLDQLCSLDGKLASIRERLGDPPEFRRPASFATLVRIIMEQQVSLASGRATFKRLNAACGGSTNAKRIGELTDDQMRRCGLSRQKAKYVASLAKSVRQREFSVSRLARLSDEEARRSITGQLGMGDWTADIYLMMALRRPDIFPVGDLALVKGVEHLDQTSYTADEIKERGEGWRPFRSTATMLIWTDYLDRQSSK